VPKVLGMVLFFGVSLLGLIPLYVKSFQTNKKLMSLVSCFSAGLFISVGLMHILPEA
jgi:zinc transporter 1/2/3